MLREHRLVTVTGLGGVGKTRLDRRVPVGPPVPEFLDGIAFVPLADVRVPDDFVPALAAVLDVKEAEGRTLGDGIVALIGERKALLLLDNLEQVVAAAPEVAGLVESCPGLRVLISSRTPLRIAAEREYPPGALAPAPGGGEPAASIMSYPAIALFVDRARAAKRLVRAHASERGSRRRNLPSIGRAPSRDRARRRSTGDPVTRGAARAARPRPPRADSRSSRHSRAAADVARHDRLEPCAAHRVGAASLSADGRVRRRVHVRGRRGRLRRAG